MDARINSQGPSHASERAIERANSNSVLHRSTTATTRLRDRDNDDADDGPRNSHGLTTRTAARANSQGPAHASQRALSRANSNSVLSGSTTTTTHRLTTRAAANSHGVTTRTRARLHSRGPLHASARARTRVNANSVLSGTTATVTTHGRSGR